MEIQYIIIGLIILVVCYNIFMNKDTFINRKLENFKGDDLNIHINNDLNIISQNTNDEVTVIE